MKKTFEYHGDRVRIVTTNPEQSKDTLIPAVYNVSYSEFLGYFMTFVKDKFEVPSVVFGNFNKRLDKVINTFNCRDTSTGVLLTGDKGSGKTMLTELISNKMIDSGIPVILVNEAFAGEEFNKFISDIGVCVIIFDEFAKVYNREQESLLTLLDGTLSGKRLVFLTENNHFNVNEFFINRPGRIFYHFEYSKLDEDTISEYCDYYNVSEVKQDIIDMSRLTTTFSMDILKALVDEYKRYKEPVSVIVKDLNIHTRKSEPTLEIHSVKSKSGELLKFKPKEYSEQSFRLGNGYFSATVYTNDQNSNNVSSSSVDAKYDDSDGDTDYFEFSIADVIYEDLNQIIVQTNKYKLLLKKNIPDFINPALF